MDPIFTKLLESGGLAGVAGGALYLLWRTIGTIRELQQKTLDALTQNTAASTKLTERIEELLESRSHRRAS